MQTIAAAKKAGWETKKKKRGRDSSLLWLGVQCVWQQEPDHFAVVAVKEKNALDLAPDGRHGDGHMERRLLQQAEGIAEPGSSDERTKCDT